jgi:hypothetical protein
MLDWNEGVGSRSVLIAVSLDIQLVESGVVQNACSQRVAPHLSGFPEPVEGFEQSIGPKAGFNRNGPNLLA